MLTESDKALRGWMNALAEDTSKLEALKVETEQRLSEKATGPRRRSGLQVQLDIFDREICSVWGLALLGPLQLALLSA
ncbi:MULTISPECIES: hypothetical protein [unclassified Deinococcus]|uniref:hypothetical protein n=1 Tax=unclassified Deinococcus TaxID=2623546 RepID=UPI001E2CD738|nr:MULTISPECIES: hypothetical protein [unclassified Deinococcus]MCD0160371.1 hypothetical protein [Deinococcus sp. 6YEL10]MCD0168407.1 hypothetical protein [Deinococcus sp. 23YEL01]MCD0174563.1 hypothetical protein [Deinococcus sp. 14RED07]